MHFGRSSLAATAMVATAALGLFAGLLSAQTKTLAQESTAQIYTIQAGGHGPGNAEVLAFAPQAVQVHRGDTISWVVKSFHNIRFGSEPLELVSMTEVDGQPVPAFNPAIAFPTIENGATYSGGEAGSGLPEPGASPVFSLVIDLEPGTYSYLCDIHPGMAGVITVVDDATAIPAPLEVAMQGEAEVLSSIGAAIAAGGEAEAQAVFGSNEVTAGSGDTGRATVNQFFPNVTRIQAGESVTWSNPEGSVEPHLVAWPPVRGQDVAPIMVEGGPPVLAIGPSLMPMTENGATIASGDSFSSGLFNPGQSFSLTFSEPGVYPYTCNIHPGMNGVVIVDPAA